MHGIPKLSIFFTAFAGVLTSAFVARADIAAPRGYVESCTPQKQQHAGEECVSCSAYHGYQSHCSEWLDGFGFTSRCHSRGASVWGEVWCRRKDASAKALPPEVLAGLQNNTSHPPDAGAAPVAPPTALATPTATAPESPTATAAPTAEPPVAPTTTTAMAPPAVDPKPQGNSGCGGCNAGGNGMPIGGALLAGAAALAFVVRRRRG